MKNKEKMKQLSAQELGDKLLKSVKEMKAGKAARITKVAPSQAAAARSKTGLFQIIAGKRTKEI